MPQQMTPAQLRRGYGPIIRRLSRCGTELPNPAKLVLLNLLERLGQSASAWPTQATIASDTGLSERAVVDALAHLREAGFVAARHMPGVAGRRNIYDLDLGALLKWAEHRKPDTAPDAHPDVHTVHVHTAHGAHEVDQLRDQDQDRVNHAINQHHRDQPKGGAPAAAGGHGDRNGDPILSHAVERYTTEITAGLTPLIAQELGEWAEELREVPHWEAALDAGFAAAAAQNRRSWSYVRAVLRRQREDGWPADPQASRSNGREGAAAASAERWKPPASRYNAATGEWDDGD